MRREAGPRFVVREINIVQWMRVSPHCLEIESAFKLRINSGGILELFRLGVPEASCSNVKVFRFFWVISQLSDDPDNNVARVVCVFAQASV